MKRLIRDTAPVLFVGISVVLFLTLILFVLPAYSRARSAGEKVGETKGDLVGTAIGTFNGVTQDYVKGWNEGKERGLSADDTIVEDIRSIVMGTGNLQILVAGITISDFNKVGDKYASIYLHHGEAIFTVNLSEAEVVEQDEDTISVKIPQPEIFLTIDEMKVEKIAEWESVFFNGTTEEGYTAYNNSMSQIRENVREYIDNYDVLFDQARNAAKEKVEMLVTNMTDKDVNVEFLPGGEE